MVIILYRDCITTRRHIFLVEFLLNKKKKKNGQTIFWLSIRKCQKWLLRLLLLLLNPSRVRQVSMSRAEHKKNPTVSFYWFVKCSVSRIYSFHIPVEQDKQHKGIGRQARVAPKPFVNLEAWSIRFRGPFCIRSNLYSKRYSTGVVEINRQPVFFFFFLPLYVCHLNTVVDRFLTPFCNHVFEKKNGLKCMYIKTLIVSRFAYSIVLL